MSLHQHVERLKHRNRLGLRHLAPSQCCSCTFR